MTTELMAQRQPSIGFLPAGMQLLLVSRAQAAALLSIAPTTFDRLRKSHALLRPVRIGSRTLWPTKNLLEFVDTLIECDDDADDPWSGASA